MATVSYRDIGAAERPASPGGTTVSARSIGAAQEQAATGGSGALAVTLGALTLSAAGTLAGLVTITAPTPFRVHQRAAGVASVTVSGAYGGSPTTIEARVDAGAWATLVASPAGGTYSAPLSVPEGTHSVSVRFSNDTAVTATVLNVLVGDVFLVIGQSNAEGALTNFQGYTHASQKAGKWVGAAWSELADPTVSGGVLGSPWPLVATLHMADQGVPFGVINKAASGTAIATWWDGAAQANWTAAKAAVTASGVSALAAVLIDIGETDAINDTPEATFNSRLDGLANDVAATYGLPLVVAHTGTTSGIDAGTDLDAVRAAEATAWGDNANVKPGPSGLDRGSLHWTSDADGLTIARRWWLCVEQQLYGGTDARGPRVQSASFNAARTTVRVVFDRNLKTGLSHWTSPWAVADTLGAVTVSAVAYHGTDPKSLVLTLGAAAVGASTVTFGSGNVGATVVIPRGPDVVVPTGETVNLPAEPVYALAVAEASLTADLSATLGALTLSATGKVAITGVLSATLGELTLSAAGTLSAAPITGALSVTLGALTLSATGVGPGGGVVAARTLTFDVEFSSHLTFDVIHTRDEVEV